jgi:hypothetical protein
LAPPLFVEISLRMRIFMANTGTRRDFLVPVALEGVTVFRSLYYSEALFVEQRGGRSSRQRFKNPCGVQNKGPFRLAISADNRSATKILRH